MNTYSIHTEKQSSQVVGRSVGSFSKLPLHFLRREKPVNQIKNAHKRVPAPMKTRRHKSVSSMKPKFSPKRSRETSPVAAKVAIKKEPGRTSRKRSDSQLKKNNDDPRKSNSRGRIQHKSAWGVDQRQFQNDPETLHEQEIMRNHKREEREKTIKAGRSRIGLGYFKTLKRKQSSGSKENAKEKPKEKTPEIKKYILYKKKQLKINQMTEKLEALLKENLREKALHDLDKKYSRKQKKKTKKRRFTRSEIPEIVSIDPFSRDQAAIIIQRWFRKIWSQKQEVQLLERFRSIVIDKKQELDYKFLKNEAIVQAQMQELDHSSKNFPSTSESRGPTYRLRRPQTIEIIENLGEDFPDLESESSFSLSEHSYTPDFSLDSPGFEKITEKLIEHSSENSEPEQATFEISTHEQRLDEEIDKIIEKEVTNYLRLLSFSEKSADVDPSFDFIQSCLDTLFVELLCDEDNLLELINLPLDVDFRKQLKRIRQSPVGELVRISTLELILHTDYSEVLRDAFNTDNLYSRGFYLQMIFDCINEALNYLRPFGTEGPPPPWNKTETNPHFHLNLAKVWKFVQNYLRKWHSIQGGPIEDSQETDELKEDRMSNLICADVKVEEELWTRYADEEVQLSCQISDVLFEFLVEETIIIIN